MTKPDGDKLQHLLDTIRVWIETESGPMQMKFSIPDLQVSVSFHGYRKIILERTFPKVTKSKKASG